MNLRFGHAADHKVVVALERSAATAPHWPESIYLAILQNSNDLRGLFVVEEEHGVVGFCVVNVVAGVVGELENVVVAEGFRRLGAGTQLCRAAMAWCHARGAAEMELEVRSESLGVRRIYERLGFEEVGRRRRYYVDPVDDAVLMRMQL